MSVFKCTKIILIAGMCGADQPRNILKNILIIILDLVLKIISSYNFFCSIKSIPVVIWLGENTPELLVAYSACLFIMQI